MQLRAKVLRTISSFCFASKISLRRKKKMKRLPEEMHSEGEFSERPCMVSSERRGPRCGHKVGPPRYVVAGCSSLKIHL